MHHNPTRYPLNKANAWFITSLFGVWLGWAIYSILAAVIRTHHVGIEDLLDLVVAVLVFLFVGRNNSIYVELTDEALFIGKRSTHGIPLQSIDRVELPGPGEFVKYDDLIGGSGDDMLYSNRWHASSSADQVLLHVGKRHILIEFADRRPFYEDLMARLEALEDHSAASKP